MSASAAQPWRAIIAIVIAAAVFGVTYGLSSPLIALELHRLGYSDFIIGLNSAMQALGVLTVAGVLPGVTRRFGLRRTLVLALLLVTSILLLFPLAAWIWLWFPLRLLLGIGAEGVMVTTESWISHVSDDSNRTTRMAVYTGAVSLGLAFGPLLLGQLGTGGALPFVVGAGFAALAGLLLLCDRRPAPHFPRVTLDGGMAAVVRQAPVAMAATALTAALETSGLTFLPMYAVRKGWSEQDGTSLVATLLIGAIVLQLPIGWLGDRCDRRKLVLLCSALAAGGALLWPWVIGIGWLAYAVLFFWGGVFVGIYTLMVSLVGSRYDGAQLVQVYAVLSVAFGIGALIGPLLAGAAMSLASDGLPLFAAVACAVFGLFAWRARTTL